MSTTPRGRVLPLDGLRTVAILAVIAYHLHLPQATGGFLGVTVFFVLSGYLITTLLIREHRRTGRIRLGRFAARRILRLYPALLAVVLTAVALWPSVGDYKGATLSAGAAAAISLTYTGNLFRAFWHTSQGVLAQTWSLAMEEQFYLVWPAALVLLTVLRARRWAVVGGLGVLVIVCSATAGLVYEPRSGSATPDVYFNPVLGAAPLLTGCALALTLDDDRVRAAVRRTGGSVLAWTGTASLVAGALWIDDDWTQHPTTFALVMPAAGIAAAVLVAGLVVADSGVARVLSWRPVAWFGRRVSYSAYLWHPLVIALLTPLAHGIWGKLTVLGISLAVATGAACAVEVPVERIQGRLRTARAIRMCAAAPAGADVAAVAVPARGARAQHGAEAAAALVQAER